MRPFRNEREFALWQDGRRTRWASGAHIDTQSTSGAPSSRAHADRSVQSAAHPGTTTSGREAPATIGGVNLPSSPHGRMLTGPLTLLLPWPPSGNHATKHTTTGAHYLTAEHKRFRSAVKWIAYQMRAPTIASPYRCAIVWYPPDRRERDSDNLQKVTFDALRHAGVIEGDSMADKIAYSEVVVMPAKPGEGAVSVRIERA